MTTEPEVLDSTNLGDYNRNFVPVAVMEQATARRPRDRYRVVRGGDAGSGNVPGYGGGVPTSYAVPSGAVPGYRGGIGGPGSMRRAPGGAGIFDDILHGFNSVVNTAGQVASVAAPFLSFI